MDKPIQEPILAHYPVVVMSDMHFGRKASRPKLAYDFLRHVSFDRLYLAGDTFEGWRLERKWRYRELEKRVHDLLNYRAAQGAEIILLPGNHDERLERMITMFNMAAVMNGGEALRLPIPVLFKDQESGLGAALKIAMQDEINVPDGRRYLVCHGHQYDPPDLKAGGKHYVKAKIGDYGYDALMRIDEVRKVMRKNLQERYGRDYSLAARAKRWAKQKYGVKRAFEDAVSSVMKHGVYNGFIMGHLHDPERRVERNGFVYLNTGDWMENFTAGAMDEDGELRLIEWLPLRAEHTNEPLHGAKDENPYAAYRGVTTQQLSWMHRLWPGKLKGTVNKTCEYGS